MYAQREKRGIFRNVMGRNSISTTLFTKNCSKYAITYIGLEKVLCNAKDTGLFNDGCTSCLKFNSSGTRLATALSDCSVSIYDVDKGKCKSVVSGHSEIVTSLAWINSEESSFYTSSLDKTIRLWRGGKTVDQYLDHSDWIRSLALSKDEQTLVSGCVSSNLFVRDTQTGKTKHSIHAMEDLKGNLGKNMSGPMRSFCTSFDYSVNAIDFFSTNNDVFVSGVRDGTVRIWDLRDMSKGSVKTLFAHNAKLNQVQVGYLDNKLLTSGRDGIIRLWETRMLGGDPKNNKRALQMEFKGHKCHSYNISCTFFSNDRTIATGSEDSKIWIYDVENGQPLRVLQDGTSVVHFLATPSNDSGNLRLASCSIDNSMVKLWSTCHKDDQGDRCSRKRSRSCQSGVVGVYDGSEASQGNSDLDGSTSRNHSNLSRQWSTTSDANNASMTGDSLASHLNAVPAVHRSAVENLMHKHGDLILRIFHAYDYSFRAPCNWQALLAHIYSMGDSHFMVNESHMDDLYTDLRKLIDFLTQIENRSD